MQRHKISTKFWLVITAIIILPIILIAIYRITCKSEFDRKVEALRAQGFPISMDDLEKIYAIPQGFHNAADVYIEAFSHYQQPTEEQEVLLPYSGEYKPKDGQPPFPNEVIDTIQSFLQQNRKTLDLLEQAAKIENCIWPRTLKDSWPANENLGNAKDAMKLMRTQNLYLAQKGDTGKLFNSMQTSIALANTFSKPDHLWAHLVINALKGVNAVALEDIMNQVTFSKDQMAILQKNFTEMQDINGFHKSLIIERCDTIKFWQLPPNEQAERSYNSKPVQLFYSLSGLKQMESLDSLDFMDECIAASQLPLHQRYNAFEKIDAKFNYSITAFMHLYLEGRFFTEAKVNRIDLFTIADLRKAQTALAIERYRRKHNTIPDSLEELVPQYLEAVPRDPFDNEHLRYIKLENGFTVYSIGDDHTDNGGISRDQARKMSEKKLPHDWPFTVKWK